MATDLSGIIDWLKGWFYDKPQVDNEDVEFMVTTHGTTATGSWTATSTKLTELKNGTKIILRLTSNGSGNATLNLTLANGTPTGAKPIYYSNTTRLTTHYGANSVIELVYYNNAWYMVQPPTYGQNNNDYLRVETRIISGESAQIPAYRIIGGVTGNNGQGKYYIVKANLDLDMRYPILYNTSAINSDSYTDNVYQAHITVPLTNNVSGKTVTSQRQVYIEGTSYSNNILTVSNKVFVSDDDLTDGNYYVYIGASYSTTYIRMDTFNQMVYKKTANGLIPVSDWNTIENKPSTYYTHPSSKQCSHSHGSLANGGTLNSDITSVNKVAVTDSSNNLKTISQLPYSKLSGTPSIPSKTSDLTNDGDGTNVFVKNDDTRLSNARTPTSHTHGFINNDGTLGGDSDKSKVVITNSSGKIATGTVGTSNIADGAVTNAKIADNTIEMKKLASHTYAGTSGTAGYVKLLRFNITGNYQDRPIQFKIERRHATEILNCFVTFKGASNSDPDIGSFVCSDEIGFAGGAWNSEVYLYKEDTSTWSLIVRKSENYDSVILRELLNPCSSITVTKIQEFITSLPTSSSTNPLKEIVCLNTMSEYIEGTHGTAKTGTWTGTATKLARLTKGTHIYFKMTSPGNGNATLNLTLADGTTTTGAKEVWYNASTRFTTHLPQNTVLNLVYDGTKWINIAIQNTNNFERLYANGQVVNGESSQLPAGVLICGKTDQKYYKVASGVTFNVRYPIFMLNAALNSDATTNNVYHFAYWVNLQNTLSGITLTTNKMTYIEGTAFSNGNFTISSTVFRTEDTITSANGCTGKFYYPIGMSYSTKEIRFEGAVRHDVYYFDGTNLKPVEDYTYATSGHNHDSTYLKLSGGTLTGTVLFPVGSNSASNTATGNIPWAGSPTYNTDLWTTLKGQKSGMFTFTDGSKWWNVISNRHRNGGGDGNGYGMYIRTTLQDDGSLLWAKQKGASSFMAERTILDSSNYSTYANKITKTSQLTNDGDGTNVFVKNNDTRLSNARTPTSHTHGNLQNDGKVGTTNNASKNVVTDSDGKITTEDKPYNINEETPFRMFVGQGQYQNLYTFLNYLHENAGTLSSTYAPKYHATNNSTTADGYGKASTSNWGHVKLDSSPTQNSSNAVTSGGLYTALDEKSDVDHEHDASDISFNPNTEYWGEWYQGISDVGSALDLLGSFMIDLIDQVYPVGAIYMSVNNTNPATLFGGTWVQLKDRFLLGAGDTYTNGSTGGSKDAVVVSHNHKNANGNGWSFLLGKSGVGTKAVSDGTIARGYAHTTGTNAASYLDAKNTTAVPDEGVAGTDKNMPPYLVVYMWKRTA